MLLETFKKDIPSFLFMGHRPISTSIRAPTSLSFFQVNQIFYSDKNCGTLIIFIPRNIENCKITNTEWCDLFKKERKE